MPPIPTQETALLIIDLQTAMFESDKYIPHKGEELLCNVEHLLTRARSSTVPVLYVQHTEAPGCLLAKDAPGWPLYPRIAPLPGEPVVNKTHPDGFHDTELHTTLEDMGISRLLIAGMQTEFCMDSTIRRAFSMGYESYVVKDAHSTFDTDILPASSIVAHHNNIWHGRFALTLPTAEVSFGA